MANGEWYYASGGQQQGPVPVDTLRQMLASGQLQPGDLVWSQGMPNWSPASAVPELLAAPAAPGHPPYPAPAPQPYGGPQAYNALGHPAPAYPGQIGYYTPPTTYIPFAGFWARFAAAFIDGLIISLPFTILGWVLGYMYGDPSFGGPNYGGGYRGPGGANTGPDDPVYLALSVLINLASLAAGWLYDAIQTSGPHMATIGKRALGIRVTDVDGRRISFGRATGRHFAKILSGCICLVGYIMAAFTEKKQALHDMMASTLVVQGKAEQPEQVHPYAQ